MAVLGSSGVDGLGKVKLLDNDTRTQVEVVPDDLDQLLRGLVGGTVGLNEDRERVSDTNGIRELDKGTTGELSADERLGDPTGDVSGGTVNLGVVLSGESTTTVSTPATVGVDDDLTAGQTGVTLGTANDEAARGLQVVDGAVIEELVGDNLLDDLLLEGSTDLLRGDVVSVLGGDDNSVHTQGLDSTVVVGVLDSDLGLGVRENPGDGAVKTGFLHGVVELVRQQDGQGQELRSLVGSITEHDTLVTGTELLKGLIIVKTLGNVRRLLLNGNQDIAGLVVETLLGGIETNVLDGTTDDLLVVKVGLGGDFTENHNHTCAYQYMFHMVPTCAN